MKLGPGPLSEMRVTPDQTSDRREGCLKLIHPLKKGNRNLSTDGSFSSDFALGKARKLLPEGSELGALYVR